MAKLVRPILTILLGIMLGIYLYQQFSPQSENGNNPLDTSFVQKAHAEDIQSAISASRQNAITRAVKRVRPAVVSVNVTKVKKYIQRSPYSADPFYRLFFPEIYGNRVVEKPVASVGSGFIISSDGYVLTNEHVVFQAAEIVVAMSDGKEYPAKLIGKDHVSDVALLKIDKDNLPTIELGNSDQTIIGEWAIALGNPFGLFVNNSSTVTVGVISAVNRDFSPTEGRVYEDMLQTDAAINPGNSGGPLCNADGQAIGMNTFILTGSSQSSGSVGVGFAIPSNHIQQVIEKIKKRGNGDSDIWIGLYGIDLNAYLARMIGFNSTRGVLIKRIDAHSPASKAGIELGDVLLTLNGIDVPNTQVASQVIQSMDLYVGDQLKASVWREGKIKEFSMTLEKYPER